MTIDSIRGILALFIVWHHLGPATGIPYHCDFGYTIVLFFFILSGFHMALTWKERISTVPYRVFISKRCAKIFPIQWLTVILALIVGMDLAAWWTVPLQLALIQSFVPLWESYFSLHVVSWFLSSLFFCYLLTYAVLKLAVNHLKLFVILLCSSILGFIAVISLLPDFIGHRWIVYFNPFGRLIDYSLGILMAIFWFKFRKREETDVVHRRSIILFTALELLFCALMAVVMVDVPWNMGKFIDVRYPIVIGFIIIFSLSKGYISRLLSNRALIHLGTISLSIYMFHPIVLHFYLQIKEIMPEWCAIALMYLIVILGSNMLTRHYLPLGAKLFMKIANKF